MRIAVLSDIHGVAAPYRAALNAARCAGFDVMLILGDLLTYGVDPVEVLELTEEAVERNGAVLIVGNHDEIYAGEAQLYRDRLPDWIKESVDWTERAIEGYSISTLPWQEDWSEGSLYAAHANPFGARNWTYLNEPEKLDRACLALKKQGMNTGIFGHIHRADTHHFSGVSIHIMASLGQPRDRKDRQPGWAAIELEGGQAQVTRHSIGYDWAEQIAAINATTFSDTTKARLGSFYL